MSLKYRHEYKYIVDNRDIQVLCEILNNICDLDSHVGDKGKYQIRSIYFDDFDDSFYYANENGDGERYKYRIRIYDQSDEYVSLEKKSKKNGMTLKESTAISKERVIAILKNDQDEMLRDINGLESPLLQEFMLQRECKLLQPKVIVQYERIPFVYEAGNVRITIDLNCSSSNDFWHFWDEDLFVRPVLGGRRQLLEIKYDEYLPSFLQRQLNLGNLYRTSFSKYYLCRRYSL